MTELVLSSRRVVLPDGVRPASVVVRDGRIAALEPRGRGTDLRDTALLPGVVDTHVHVNEPGRTHWEGFGPATRAAAAGGVTTVVDMPLNSLPPTVDVNALRLKRAAASGQCAVDVGFWGGAVPGPAGRVTALHADGVFGAKCFLLDSGVPEFPPLDDAGLRAALAELAAVDGLLLVHAEEAALVGEPADPSFSGFVASRPPAAEARAVERVVAAARDTGARAHVVHVSAAATVAVLAATQADGVRVSAETCPHYLVLDPAELPDTATAAKCCPPVRGGADREALWAGLRDGVLGAVVSDHSPSPPDLKGTDLRTAWGGISSLQLALPLVWTAARERGHDLADVARWMCSGPADLARVAGKGRIEVGADADLVAFDPEEEFVVDPAALRSRHPVTPYAGRRLAGVVRSVWLRGRPVDPSAPHGVLLRRGERVA